MNDNMVRGTAVQAAACGVLATLGLAMGQAHPGDYAPADIAYRSRLYDAQSTTCHGASGDGVAAWICPAASSAMRSPITI
jgi:cytochrome c